MKALVLTALTLALSSNALAAPATAYSCVGKNKVNGEAVVFEVLMADHAPGAGYTNQSVTVIKRGWETLAKPLTLQMYDATKKNNCQPTGQDELYMHEGFDMTPAPGNTPAYETTFKSACSADQQYDVTGFCFFQN